jgi:hypothetical protein
MGDIAQRGNRLTFAKGGTVRRPKKPSTHGKDVPTMAAKGGRIGKFGGGRTNLLEELGRVEAEPSNRNRRAEISRVHGELNRGYAIGGGVKKVISTLRPGVFKKKGKKTHGKDVPTMAAEGGRIGLKDGSKGKPWGTGPKPGTHEFMEHTIHKRKRKAIGGVLKHAIKKLRPAGPFKPKKKVYPETEDLTHQKGPYVGDVGSEGKKARKFAKRSHKKEEEARREDKATGGRIGLKKGGSDKKWIQKAVNPKHKGYCTPMTKKTCTPARKALARTFKKKAKTGWG